MGNKTSTEVVAAVCSMASQRAPVAGDVWWVDLNPVKGHEQGGAKRPVVVLTPERWNRATQRATVVPITRTRAPAGTQRATLQVEIASLKEPSVALPDQVTTIDWVARRATFHGEQATAQELGDIRQRLAALLGMDG